MDNTKDELIKNLKTIKEYLEDVTKQLGLKELKELINECKRTSNKNLIKNN